jgi:hypothetical protein
MTRPCASEMCAEHSHIVLESADAYSPVSSMSSHVSLCGPSDVMHATFTVV